VLIDIREPIRALPELVSYLEGLPEPHILFDRQYRIAGGQCGLPAPVQPAGLGGGAHLLRGLAPLQRALRPGRRELPAGACARVGQRERVLHLHHTPQGEEYVNIELVPLRDAAGELAWFIEKMEPLRVAQGEARRRRA
jgi:two-component system response regulator HydG